jgi:hypothetical protein
MMAYDRVVVELNAARLRGASFPIVHAFIQAALSLNPDRTHQVVQLFHILAKITGEPPGIPSLAHAGAHILNTPPLERCRARAHLGDPTSREAVELSKQIAAGACAGYDPWYIQARLSVNSLDSFSLAITLAVAVAVASSFPLTISCLRQRHRHWFAVNTRLTCLLQPVSTRQIQAWSRLPIVFLQQQHRLGSNVFFASFRALRSAAVSTPS